MTSLQKPTPATLPPSLKVTDVGRVYLHADLVAQLRITHAQPINLVPPPKGSPYWHLDLRPEAGRAANPNNNGGYRIDGVRLPFGLLDPSKPLTLYLVPGEPAKPGYYPLLPAEAFTQAYTAFLAQAARAARQGLLPSG